MRVLIDLLYITTPNIFGISKYGLELLEGFLAHSKNEIGILCCEEMREFISEKSGFEGQAITVPLYTVVSQQSKWFRYRSSLPFSMNEITQYDICISPYANDPLYLLGKYIKHVGVIHDMQLLHLVKKRKNFIFALCKILYWRYAYKSYTSIIAISKSTNRDIQKFCGRKSSIIYNALKRNNIAPPIRPDSMNNGESLEYILDVNSFAEYKNADVLLKAFAKVHEKHPQLFLYLKGDNRNEYDRLPVLASNLGIKKYVIFDRDNRTDSEMQWLYQNAKLFVSPSLMEGFGYSPVEAVFNKIPTIVSDIPIFHEINTDSVTYFDPYDIESLESAILAELNNPTSADELELRALKQRSRFSVKRQINEFDSVICNVKNGNT